MRLLKIIVVFFAIYFIRRFIQMYRVMKSLQEQRINARRHQTHETKSHDMPTSTIINAEFKVLD